MNLKFSLLTLILLIANFSTQAQEKIAWAASFAEAEKMARETGKPLMLDFTAEWCGLCREMDRSFWTRPDVIELAKDFVGVKIDGEKNWYLTKSFDVRGYPTVVFADPWNAERDAHMGFGQNGDRVIIDKAKQFPKDFGALKEAGGQLEKSKTKADGLQRFAEFYRENRLPILSIRIYREVLTLEKSPDKRETALLNSAADFIKLGQPSEALKLYEKLQSEFPESARADEFRYGIFYANLRRNNLPEAATNLAKLKTDFPASNYISQAEDLFAKASK